MSRPAAALALVLTFALAASGCASKPPYDYSAFWQHPPKSILVLPPLNESSDVEATYGYLSTVTRPLADRGYYVYPVAVVDQLFKQNGLPTAGEMHQVSLQKLAEVTGADAVLFVTIAEYSTQYRVITSQTEVKLTAKLIDTRSEVLLWQGDADVKLSSGYSIDPIQMMVNALMTQIIDSTTRSPHHVSETANYQLIFDKTRGLPEGPYDAPPGPEAAPQRGMHGSRARG